MPSISVKIWLLLAAGPMLFLIAFFATSVFFATRGVPPPEIAGRVISALPQQLIFVQMGMACCLLWFLPEAASAWRHGTESTLVQDFIVGALVGSGLAAFYLRVIVPLLPTLQRTLGDYVTPGPVLPALSSSLGAFFIANVLLAPVIEETLYRGIALPALGDPFGPWFAALITCLFFGLLHWAGGVWYMLLTGIVAGGVFAALWSWRGGLMAPFAAHLALNIIEFIYAWHAQRNG
jgi:membrane protease YdiL (CAAX protease family)